MPSPALPDQSSVLSTTGALNAFVSHGISPESVFNVTIWQSSLSETSTCSRIHLVAMSDRPDLYAITFPRLRDYAIRHNYSYTLFTGYPYPERAPAWGKIQLMKSEIERMLLASELKPGEAVNRGRADINCNNDDSHEHNTSDGRYVVWIDDDIFISNANMPLEWFMHLHQFGRQASMPSATASPDDSSTARPLVMAVRDPSPWFPCPVNTGLLIARAVPEAVELLQKIWDAAPLIAPNTLHGGFWEQDVVRLLWQSITHHFVVLNDRTLHSHPPTSGYGGRVTLQSTSLVNTRT